MTPADHYRVAEQILRDPHLDTSGAAIAQVHATLATAYHPANDDDARTLAENASKYRTLAEEYHARAEQAKAERDGWKSIAESNARYAEKADQECHDWRRRAERNAAETARYYRKLRGIECPHGYRLTDSCPNCDAIEDRADPRRQDCGATNREECCATRGTGDAVEDIEQ